MRRVMVFEMKLVEGRHTGYSRVEKGEARFHQWGLNYEDSENGPGNYSTAIVEFDDGTVDNVPAELVQFLDR